MDLLKFIDEERPNVISGILIQIQVNAMKMYTRIGGVVVKETCEIRFRAACNEDSNRKREARDRVCDDFKYVDLDFLSSAFVQPIDNDDSTRHLTSKCVHWRPRVSQYLLGISLEGKRLFFLSFEWL